MSEDTVLTYLDDYKIITYPKLINLCMLFHKINPMLIDQLIKTFLNSKFKDVYTQQFEKIFDHTLAIFETLGGKICGFEGNPEPVDCIGIAPKPKGGFDPYWIDEIVSYLLDTAANLNGILSFCPDLIPIALNKGLPFRLAYFYNRVYHELYTVMNRDNKVPYEWTRLKYRIDDNLTLGRWHFTEVYHIFVLDCLNQVIRTR